MSLIDEINKEIADNQLQGSQGWFETRKGKFTSSQIHRLLGVVKREMTDEELLEYKKANPKSTAKLTEDPSILSDAALKYVKECVWETITGQSIESGSSKATMWGEEQEGYAREEYALRYGKEVAHAGFTVWQDAPNDAGGSCDFKLMNENAIGEIKCPLNGGIYVDYFFMDLFDMPNEYYIQCQSNLLFTGADLCYFVAYDPRVKAPNNIRVIEVPRNNKIIELIELKLRLAIKRKYELLKQFTTI